MYTPCVYRDQRYKSVEIVHSMDASGKRSYTIDAPWRNLRVRFCEGSCRKVCRKRLLNATAVVPNYSRDKATP